jgi:hypothetical protein
VRERERERVDTYFKTKKDPSTDVIFAPRRRGDPTTDVRRFSATLLALPSERFLDKNSKKKLYVDNFK